MVSVPFNFPKKNSLESWSKIKLKQWEKAAQSVILDIFYDESLLIPLAKDLADKFCPEEMRQEIKKINERGGLTHLYLQGLPKDPYLPVPPIDGKGSAGKRTMVSELVSLGILLGIMEVEPFAYLEEKEGALIHQVVPLKGLEKTQSNASIGKFQFHNDNASLKRAHRPEGIILNCLMNQGTSTYFADVDEIIKALHPIDLQVLREERFRVRTPDSFNLFGGKMISSDPRPIIMDGDAGAEIAVNLSNVMPVYADDEEAKNAILALHLALRSPVAKSFILEPGDLFIFSNVRGLHARGPISGNRWLQRAYFRKNLSDLRRVTNSSNTCRKFISEKLFLL